MKILFCFWSQFDDIEGRGGGVRLYMENTIKELVSRGHSVYTLSSGISYSLSHKCYIRKLGKNNGVKKFDVVNSPIMSPGHFSFYNQRRYLNDQSLKDAFFKFAEKEGGFDVIHFHGSEGFTLEALTIKEKFPQTRVFLSIHNYHPFCPQVNLWYQEKKKCDDYEQGLNCINCLKTDHNTADVTYAYMLSNYLNHLNIKPKSGLYKIFYLSSRIFYFIFRSRKKVEHRYNKEFDYKQFSKYRNSNVDYINNYVDKVFPVSNRAAEICAGFGIEKNLLKTLYIGSKFADSQKFESTSKIQDDFCRIAYIGYMRRDKGFYFLLKELEKLDDRIASRIELVIASKVTDAKILFRVKRLLKKFKTVDFHDGYTHNNLKEILKGVHLGIVPVLWEDNLPQVAFEFKGLGIPVLASDYGGASELTTSEHFKFSVTKKDDFKKKLTAIMDQPDLITDYWEKGIPLKTIPEHVDELLEFY